MAETVQQQLREWLEDDGPAVRYDDRTWTWREHLAEASAEASALLGVVAFALFWMARRTASSSLRLATLAPTRATCRSRSVISSC